jgi:hypothetical protein
VKKDLDRFSVRRHDDHLADTAIQRLGGFVGSLFDLLVVGCLLDKIQQGNRQIGIGKGKGFLGHGGKVSSCDGYQKRMAYNREIAKSFLKFASDVFFLDASALHLRRRTKKERSRPHDLTTGSSRDWRFLTFHIYAYDITYDSTNVPTPTWDLRFHPTKNSKTGTDTKKNISSIIITIDYTFPTRLLTSIAANSNTMDRGSSRTNSKPLPLKQVRIYGALCGKHAAHSFCDPGAMRIINSYIIADSCQSIEAGAHVKFLSAEWVSLFIVQEAKWIPGVEGAEVTFNWNCLSSVASDKEARKKFMDDLNARNTAPKPDSVTTIHDCVASIQRCLNVMSLLSLCLENRGLRVPTAEEISPLRHGHQFCSFSNVENFLLLWTTSASGKDILRGQRQTGRT